MGHVVARLALVLAEGTDFEACGIAALGLKDRIGYRRRDGTAELTQSLGEGPHSILHARQNIVTTCRNGDVYLGILFDILGMQHTARKGFLLDSKRFWHSL